MVTYRRRSWSRPGVPCGARPGARRPRACPRSHPVFGEGEEATSVGSGARPDEGFSRDTQSMPVYVARRGAGASRRSRAGHAPLPRGGSGPPRTAARGGGPPPPRTATCPPSRASPFPPSRSARLDDRKTRSVTRALRSVASLPFLEKSQRLKCALRVVSHATRVVSVCLSHVMPSQRTGKTRESGNEISRLKGA